MYNVLRSLKSKKIMVFLMIIQLAYGLSILNNTTSIVSIEEKKIENFKRMVNVDNTYLVEVEGDFSKVDEPNVFLFYDHLDKIYEKIKPIKHLKDIYGAFPMSMRFEEIDDKVEDNHEERGNNIETSSYINQSKIIIDKNFFERYKFNVVKGRSLKPSDFDKDYKKENIPILVGNNYKNKVSIGDIAKKEAIAYVDNNGELVYKEIKFEIVGILDKNPIPITGSKTSVSSNINYSDSVSIIPTVKNYLYFNTSMILGDFGVYAEVKDGVTEESLQRKVQKILDEYVKENNLPIPLMAEVFSLKDDMEATLESLNKDLNKTKLIGGILIFLSIIGITSTMIGDIQNRKKEFGIKISQGASIKTLCKEIFLETLILVIISVLISFLFIISKNGFDSISPKLILNNVIVVLVFSLIISILPMLSISKMNVIDLVRGK